jgi:hypothetical protein
LAGHGAGGPTGQRPPEDRTLSGRVYEERVRGARVAARWGRYPLEPRGGPGSSSRRQNAQRFYFKKKNAQRLYQQAGASQSHRRVCWCQVITSFGWYYYCAVLIWTGSDRLRLWEQSFARRRSFFQVTADLSFFHPWPLHLFLLLSMAAVPWGPQCEELALLLHLYGELATNHKPW